MTTKPKRSIAENPPEAATTVEAPQPEAAEPAQEGMRCPGCGCRHMPALFTRHHGTRTYRTRRCRNCGRLVRTQERVLTD